MDSGFGTERYYKKMLDLQERLRKSEEERLQLEEKFNEMMQLSRDAEQERLRIMRHRYHKFLEEDKTRQERNENILRTLDKIESRAKMLAAKTNRFKAFRKQYEAYIKRIHRTKAEQQPLIFNTEPNQLNVHRKLFSDLPTTNKTIENKLAMLEQYLRDNFENFPGYQSTKRETVLNNNTLYNKEHQEDLLHLQNQYSDHPDSDSKDSQDDYLAKNYNDKTPNNTEVVQFVESPKKGELLGNAIEKELERLKNKNSANLSKESSLELKQPEQVIKDYKNLVSKSEEKFGLKDSTNSKPILEATNINVPNIFDNVDKTLNTTELQNFVSKGNEEKNQESYQNHVESLKEENFVPVEENILNDDPKSNKEDNSERTEPPTDVSLNLSSSPLSQGLLPDNALQVRPEATEIKKEKEQNISNDKHEENAVYVEENLDLVQNPDPENSLEESTVNEQLQSNQPIVQNDTVDQQFNEAEVSDQNCSGQAQKEINYPHEDDNQQVYDEYSQQNITEQQAEYQERYDYANSQENLTPQTDYREVYDDQQQNQVEYQPEYDVNQQNIPDSNYKEDYVQQNIDQTEYQEGYGEQQQNQVEHQPEYDVNQQNIPDSNYKEDYVQQNIDQTEYQEGYGDQQQNQVEHQPEYDVNQQNIPDSNYKEDYVQQNIDQTEYQEGYGDQQQNQVEYQPEYDVNQQNISDTSYQEQQNVDQTEGYDDQHQNQVEYQPEPTYQENIVGQEQNQQFDEQYYPEQQIDNNQQYTEGYDQQYPDQQQDYNNQQYSDYADQGYQPQDYDGQQIPVPEEQPSENVYSSEQEYLEGEQNIDQQYANDQNQEYQPQEFQPDEINEQQQQMEQIQDGAQQENNISDSDKVDSQNDFVDNKPIVEKQLPNLADMLDTDTESLKQETKVSNDSDFDFSKS